MNETNQPATPAKEEEITQEPSDQAHSEEGAIQNEKTVTSPYVLRSPSQFVNSEMFAVLRADGTVVSWGAPDYGGSTTGLDGVTSIHSKGNGFAAIREDGSVWAWENGPATPIDSPEGDELREGVVTLASTTTSFAALKDDGSVATFGPIGTSEAVKDKLKNGVTKLYSHLPGAFTALKENGQVVSWGTWADDGTGKTTDLTEISTGYEEIFSDLADIQQQPITE